MPQIECIYCGKENEIGGENYAGIKRCVKCGKRQWILLVNGEVLSVNYDSMQVVEDALERTRKD